MEFINHKQNNRKKLIYICLFFLSSEIILLIIQYLIKPFASNTITFNEFMCWSIILTIGFLAYAVYSKIIRKVDIDIDADRFSIEYIDRFQFKVKTITVKASYIQTQLDDTDSQIKIVSPQPDFFGETYQRYQSLYLTHKDFGTIMLSTRDFGEEKMQSIVKLFTRIRQGTAAKIRQRRK